MNITYKYSELDSLALDAAAARRLQVIFDDAGTKWRYELRLDGCYAGQCHATYSVWTPQGWALVLNQVGLEVDVAEHYHVRMAAPERQAMRKAGQWTPHAMDEAEALIRNRLRAAFGA